MSARLVTEPVRARRQWGAATVGVFAFLAYVPLLFTAPGQVSADTKQYLFLDPGRLLDRAPSLWHSEVHLGTVTHQNIGYLFPAGPFFWVFDRFGAPDWVAQRLWLGSILFFAGVGVLYLLRTLNIDGLGPAVAGLMYMLSPYTLAFAARISVLLLAWAALPWMIALTARALRNGGWAAPAAFALVVQITGSINLTALVFVGIAPALWVVHAVWVTREVTWRRALAAVGRIAVLTIATSLWWLVALGVQAGFGLNILDYSETVQIVATGGHSGEVLRGLGNWFFYGGDKLGPWIEASVDYTTKQHLIVVGYVLATLAILSAVALRWRHRTYFVALVVIGVLLGVGVHPYDDPSPFGALLKVFSEGSSVGLALRNVGRAVPLLVLGTAVLVGVGCNALLDRMRQAKRPAVGWGVSALVVVLVLLNLPALWNGGFYGESLQRPEEVPSYWKEAIAALDAKGHDTRILELPGADFADYRWGNAVEPITPGLTDRPYVARELIPYGSAASANLLDALDRRLQMGLLEPSAVAAVARLLSVGDIVLRNDLQVDRFDLQRPREVAQLFTPTPAGLDPPTTYGDSLDPPLRLPLLDERALALPAGTKDPAPIGDFSVNVPRPLLRAESGPGLVVSGDGDGLVDLASLGLLDNDPLVLYSATYVGDAAGFRSAATGDAVFVVTDTNRKRAQRWESLRDNAGYTERAGQPHSADPFDNRLVVFPGADDTARTVMQQRGAHVDASGYGTRHISYLPADRPARALDGDLHTAWRVGRFEDVQDEWISVTPRRPVRADQVNLVQPLDGPRDRFITRVRLEFTDRDGHRVGDDVEVDLTDASRTGDGETVTFPARRFATMKIVVEGDNIGPRRFYSTESAVGFAEIRIPDVEVDEVVRMPRDLTGLREARDMSHPLVYSMTRLRNRIAPPNIAEEEANLVRQFQVPSTRDFGIVGQARPANLAADDAIDAVLGYPGPGAGGIAARSSDRIRTTIQARASSAFDGDGATAWTTSFGAPAGQWIEVTTGAPVTFDRLDLQLVADGRHSVPTRLRIDAGGESRTVDVPPIPDEAAEDTAVSVPVQFAPLRGDTVRVTIDEIRPVETSEYYANVPILTPVAIAEVGIPGVRRAPRPPAVPSTCRADLLTLDGRPVPVRLEGDPAAAEAGGTLTARACDAGAANLGAGDHVLRATEGATTGIDLDRIVVASAAGGSPLALDATSAATLTAAPSRAPNLQVDSSDRTRLTAHVRDADGPFVLVLGESVNDGWKATVNGRDLGKSELVDGFGNGWRVDPARAGDLRIVLEWTPENRVWIALAASALAVLVCIGILVAAAVHARRARHARRGPDDGREIADDLEVPTVAVPLAETGRTPSAGVIVVTTLAVTAFGALFAAPWAGLVAGALALASLLRPRWRGFLALGAVAAIALTGAYVVVQQDRYDFLAVIEWPTFFDRVHVLGLLAVVLLAADALVEVVRGRGTGTTDVAPAAEPVSGGETGG